MPYTGKESEALIGQMHKVADFLARLPERFWWHLQAPDRLEFIAGTQEEARKIRAAMPDPLTWAKAWDQSMNWWSWTAKHPDGFTIVINACSENPPTCKAITEKKTVKVKVPTAFEEREEEQEVIVGWDCGGETAEEKA